MIWKNLLFSQPMHKQMSSGVSYGEQLVYDIERLKRHFPAVPVKVVLIDGRIFSFPNIVIK